PVHPVRAAAVLVHSRACVVRGWRDVFDRSAGATSNDDVAAGFGRALLDPIDVVAIQLDLAEADDAGHDGVGGDRRAPRAVGTDFFVFHPTRLPEPLAGQGRVGPYTQYRAHREPGVH